MNRRSVYIHIYIYIYMRQKVENKEKRNAIKKKERGE